MNDNHEIGLAERSFWDKHRLLLLIVISTSISVVLVSISMALYVTSGAAQLDLSRPNYKAVSSQAVTKDAGFENYPTSGSIDESSIGEFKKLYDTQSAKAKAVDAFGGDPLSPEALEISASQD